MSDRSKIDKKDNFLEESNSDDYILRFLSEEERSQYFRADLMGQATEPQHPSEHIIPGNCHELTKNSTRCHIFLFPTRLAPE